MFGWLSSWLKPRKRALLDLPSIDRDAVRHLFREESGLPFVMWSKASTFIAEQPGNQADAQRAIAAAWLDELRDSLTVDHRRWRSPGVEGLVPLEGSIGPSLARAAENSLQILTRDLARIRGDGAIPPVAIVALEPNSAYVDFTSAFFPEEGNFATSGGLYIFREDAFPLLSINAGSRHAIEDTVAHELTHHALHGCNLPLWIEEGLTQMMEERVTGTNNFILNAEMIARQREALEDRDCEDFLSGDGFLSPSEDDQELAYHLAQWVTRSLLATRPSDYFNFAKACKFQDSQDACERHFGVDPRSLVNSIVNGSSGVD